MKVQRMKEVQEPSRKKPKNKKRARRIFVCIRFLLITLLLVSTIIYGALSPFFNIKTIRVKEASVHYDEQTLETRSGIVPGINGFRLLFNHPGKFYFFRAGSAEKAILESCPYVKSVKVRYLPPDVISIEVREREAYAVLISEGTSLLVDREEILLEVNPVLKKSDLPVIKIKNPKELKPGKKLDLRVDAVTSAFQVYDAIREIDKQYQDKLLPDVNYVDVSDSEKTGFLLQSRVYVNLGRLEKPDDLIYKMNTVKTIFTNHIKKDEKGKLDFTSTGKPVFTPENRG